MNSKILQRCKKIARDTFEKKYRCNHVALIFKGNKILAIGRNSQKTHPKIKDYGYQDFCRLHAELSACIKFGKEDCSKYSMAVLRIDRNGHFNQSCPCESCKGVIRQLGFKKVYFTNEFGDWEEMLPKLNL